MNSKTKEFLSTVLELALTALITFACLKFVSRPYQVDGRSMETTLLDEDLGVSFPVTMAFGIKRFDICVIDTEEKLIVKRVIGLPNETITYQDNKLYINGEYYEEDFLDEGKYTEDFTCTLNDDEYFCLGDNRELSRDSRYYGPFSKEAFISLHYFCVYPFERFGYKG